MTVRNARLATAALAALVSPALADEAAIGTFQTIANQDVGQTFNTVALRSQISF